MSRAGKWLSGTVPDSLLVRKRLAALSDRVDQQYAIVSPDVHARAVTVPSLCRTTADTRPLCHLEYWISAFAVGSSWHQI
jgi:hypothetical protein